MNYLNKLIGEIELHSVEGINQCFDNGVDPNEFYNGAPLIDELTSEYTRSPRFKECVRAFIDRGLIFHDKILLAVLSDDSPALPALLADDPDAVRRKYSLRCAYTPLVEVTLMHICAEFNHVDCAKILLEYGANINARAGTDEYSFGGQTPIFHTVNQNSNQSFDMLNFLLGHSADLRLTVPGIIWGKGYEWETLIPAVNPISYAMAGLIPQMHRGETQTAKVVSLLLKAAYGIEYTPPNVPCAYLKPR